MGYIIFHVFITFFAVIGFIEVMRLLITLPLKNNNAKDALIILPESENIEYTLRSYTSRLRWQKKLRPKKIYCISDNLTQEAKEICKLFCKDFDIIEPTNLSELQQLIREM